MARPRGPSVANRNALAGDLPCDILLIQPPIRDFHLPLTTRRDGATSGLIDFEDENLSMDRAWFEDLLRRITRLFDGHPPERFELDQVAAGSLFYPV